MGVVKLLESFDNNSSSNKEKALRVTANQYYSNGVNLQNARNFQGAVAWYHKCINLVPNHVQALNAVADIYIKNRTGLDQAEMFLHRVLAFATAINDRVFCLNNLANLYLQEGRYTKALLRYQDILGLCGNHANLYYFYFQIGDCYFELDDNAKAYRYLKASLKIKSNDPYISGKLADTCVELDKYDEAILLYDKAVSIFLNNNWSPTPQNIINRSVSNALNGIATAFYHKNNLDRAKEHLLKAIDYSKNNILPWFNLSTISAQENNVLLMKKYLEETVHLIKTFPKENEDYLSEIVDDVNYYLTDQSKKIMLDTLYKHDLLYKHEYELRSSHFGAYKLNDEESSIIKDLISKGKTKEAIKHLLEKSRLSPKELHKKIVSVSGRFHELKIQQELHTISSDAGSAELNKINLAILSILEEL